MTSEQLDFLLSWTDLVRILGQVMLINSPRVEFPVVLEVGRLVEGFPLLRFLLQLAQVPLVLTTHLEADPGTL